MLIFGVRGEVLADPTPTFQPFYRTPTPGQPGNYDCPEGQPGGWGFKTPDPLWLLYCYKCVTPYPSGKDPTATPQPTATPVPNQDSRLFVLYDYFKENGEGSYVQLFNDPGWFFGFSDLNKYEVIPIYGINDTENSSYTVGIDFDWWFKYYARGAPYCTGDYYYRLRIKNSVLEDTGNIVVHFPDGENSDITVAHGETEYYNFLDTLSPVGLTKEHQIDLRIEVSMANGGRIDLRDWEVDINKVGCPSANQDKENGFSWIRGTFPPEPDPTPVPGGYCSEIPDPDVPDPWGINPLIGVADCFQIGGWEISLAWLQVLFPDIPDSITLPGMEVCLTPITFGQLKMFGIEIDLDTMAALMTGVLVIRLLTRS